jgi:hypothetical protein
VFHTLLITSRNILGFVRLVEKGLEAELSRVFGMHCGYGAGTEPAIN